MEREDRTDITTPLRGSFDEDPQAFEVAFTANFQHVHRFLARRVGSALADDLAAETFAVAFRRRASFDPSLGEVRGWLFGIATNLLRAHWREEQHLLALEARIVSEPGRPPSESDDEVLARWVAPRLARALGLLSQNQRDVLLLHACRSFQARRSPPLWVCQQEQSALGSPERVPNCATTWGTLISIGGSSRRRTPQPWRSVSDERA
jgi:RNA polymerase sigma factor (sigma-70 family)